jgi:hypothetical protein
MILYLRRKMGLLGRDEGGQSLVFVVMCLFLMFLFVCVTVDVGDFVAQKIDVQNDADAMAVSTAVWQARGLNVVQTLNVAKNIAHLHYMLEVAEVFYWLTRYIWSFLTDLYAGAMLIVSIGGYDEGLIWEKPDLEEELETLTLIQKYVAGVDYSFGSTKQFVLASIPLVDRANNGGSFDAVSTGANLAAAAGWLYDPDLKIRFQQRANFYRIVFEAFNIDPDWWVFDLFDEILDFVEVDFDWAVQTSDYPRGQYTVGLAVHAARDAPLFGSRFKAKTLIGELFGGALGGNVQLAIAQAKTFKPDDYTLAANNAQNGLGANLLAMPFMYYFSFPAQNSEALWDVKLTPVTVMDRLGGPIGGVAGLAMTH